MRREQSGTHAAHREAQHHLPHTHNNNEEPRKRAYERVIDGESPLPDELPVEVPADPTGAPPAPPMVTDPTR